ncbi:MAG: shikimate kinase [candidate division Zixibacteria bacterium]|nr:shikimate kinase [candidate division Zixibacteria bacterium]
MITPEDNIVLVGFSGTGKTVVGRLLAARLKRRFVDMDTAIAGRLGESIPGIFARYGEPRYRDEERLLVGDLVSQKGLVIAAGGGTILDDRNYRLLADSGVVVALRARPETIQKRLEREEERALLQSADPLARIRELKAARRHVYDKVPFQVQTDELSPAQVVDKIIAAVGVSGEE